MSLRASAFFDLGGTHLADRFEDCEYVWEIIPIIEALVRSIVPRVTEVHGSVHPGAHVDQEGVHIAAGATIEPAAYVQGPCYIGPGAQVRHGAYIRGGVLLAEGAVLGHASEAKNSIFFPGAKAPHFAYVGDSILGREVNLGAGVKLSNLGIANPRNALGMRKSIEIVIDGVRYDTKLSKIGAILGDGCQIGCNAVTNPGTIIGRRGLVYANTSVPRGFYADNSILKLRQSIETAHRE